jgi:hypothetical protein
MYRGREIPSTLLGHESLPHIFVVTLSYSTSDPTGLPTRAQYDEIESFEHACIDGIEQGRLGILTFVKTLDGSIRYFLYVSDVDRTLEAVGSTLNEANAAVAAGDDPEWREFKSFLQGMRAK